MSQHNKRKFRKRERHRRSEGEEGSSSKGPQNLTKDLSKENLKKFSSGFNNAFGKPTKKKKKKN